MSKGIRMSRAEAEAHQRRHGFMNPQGPCKTGEPCEHIVYHKDALSMLVPKSRMNVTETRYSLILEAMRRKTEITSYQFEGITLRLADGCKYTPDFFIIVSVSPLRVRFCEVKGGHIWDDSKVKFRVARELYSWAEWQMWQKSRSGWNQIA